MAKKIRIVLTLQLPAGKATPAPPVGTALGPHGINIVEFTKSYNEKTADKAGQIIPAQITIFEDRSFSFILKTPPAADLLRKAAGVEKGAGTAKRETVGRVSRADFLRTFPKVFDGTHTRHPGVTMRRGKRVTIEMPEAVGSAELWASGERVGPLPAQLEAVPGALRVVTCQ